MPALRLAAVIAAALTAGAASSSPAAAVAAQTASSATAPALAAQTADVPSVSLNASAPTVSSGRPVTLSGVVSGPLAGTVVRLYASPYPYPVAKLLQSTVTAANGSYSFTVHPDRSTRYRVLVAGTAAQALVQVGVVGVAIVKARAAPLGQALATIVVFHPRDMLHWDGTSVQWSFAGGAGGAFVAAAATRALTSVRMSWSCGPRSRCRQARTGSERALTRPARRRCSTRQTPPGCSGLGYRGSGTLPVGFPDPGAIARAAGYLSGRIGRKAFAVVDTEGRMSGVNVHSTFPTASVVKAMLLVGYLRRLDARGQHTVDSFSNSFLYPMIHVSDNNAATQCWSIVGDSGLYAVAHAAGMTDFSVSGLWGSALLSPADQAHFFFIMDSLIPKEFVGYARFLLSTIEASQSWGVPVVARPLGYQTFFKDGSEPTGLGQLVHQIDRLEGHGRTFSIAVMTDGDPTMLYGEQTIEGLTAALLR